ncbi:thymidine kinase [Gammaproteobacteria bacterium]|jgi:thymidine kinase|nr:thymidine kinase [Gammaproteobacteria bacterium]MDA9765772.1 thymidine kinase [Gammaproteobacteria bacterium]MDC0962121.1 thymidine kinase [Gammaproteobacteria bacterium]MDC3225609.1 thymidine kinase [Gammaproteobacteria bacterium]
MAKVYFFYSTMNAGKSTALLQSNHNYKESNLKTLLFIPSEIGNKSKGKIISRIGLESDAVVVNKKYDFFKEIRQSNYKKISCIFIDEAQFLSKIQVRSLSRIADDLNIPVMCYGIRTDFQGKLFEGSSELLAIADNLKELKTICSQCDKKATMVVRLNAEGDIMLEGKKVMIGGNDIYKTLCRKHFREITKLI